MGIVAMAALAIAGCNGKKKVPEPNTPDDEPVTVDPEPVPNRPLESGLIITASPDTDVMVDGKKVGTTPVTIDNVEPGEHEVTFMFPGEQTTLTVELAEGEYKKVHQAVSPDASDALMGN